MKVAKIALLILFPLFYASCTKELPSGEISLLPRPLVMMQYKGMYDLDQDVRIHYTDDPHLAEIAGMLAGMISGPAGYSPATDNNTRSSKGIVLELVSDTGIGKEAYKLRVTRKKIYICSSAPAGIFYGIQTLRQLFPPEFESGGSAGNVKMQAPCVYIEDRPEFEWRGMHLDVSRHFFPVEFVKEYIDLIAMHKMNVFHWHLVDDQGWRIEIRKYPKLTGVGAWRADREDQPWNDRDPQKPGEVATYGGYYTQEQIREIVKYAEERYVTIVPEIEMPAHISSALAAYPEYSCTGGPFTVPTGGLWPVSDIYCAGKDETFDFLEDILSEVIGLFPSGYIHIGGDEADKAEWRKCPGCQARIKNEGLEDEAALQSYFIKRIEKFISSKGRKLIGWDEILEGGLAPGAAVMSWRGMTGGVEAARSGHYVVMSPVSHCYFDYYQGDPSTEPKAIGGLITLEEVYSFNPVPDELTEDEAGYILGAQANLWTEYISTAEHAEYMVLPRMTALAEVLWLPQDELDWTDFSRRIKSFFRRLDIMGLNYSKSAFDNGETIDRIDR